MASGKLLTIKPQRPETWAYMAGIIDGEGHFGFRSAGRGHVRLVVVNTHRPLIDWLHDTFGGNVSARKAVSAGGKPCWNWQLSQRANLIHVCYQTEPYLIEKKVWARVTADFLYAAQEGLDRQRWDGYRELVDLTALRGR